MAVREEVVGQRRQAPVDRRPPASLREGGGPLDQTRLLEGLEVLADGGVGQLEGGRDLGCGERVGPLEPIEDAPLGVGELGHATRVAGNTEVET